MKKRFFLISASLMCLLTGVTSCAPVSSSQDANQYTLPDLYNVTLREAKLNAGANVLFQANEVETTELVEGRILGYSDTEAGAKVAKGSTVKVDVAKRVAHAKNYPDTSVIKYSDVIEKTTGPDSLNEDLCSAHGVGGTDLGIPFELPDGRMMLLYGDTFSGQNMQGIWHSNFMAITSDFDLSDGLTFDELVYNENNNQVIPFAEGLHQGGNEHNTSVEVTKIPTGGISIGNDVYIFYMSIRYWGVGGSWNVNYNQCVKATDDTYKTWEIVDSLKWREDELFYAGQIYPFHNPKDTEHIYFTSIPGGRNDGAVMFRVDKDKFENRSEYEYLTAKDTWTKGDTGMAKLNKNPYYVLNPAVSEPSIVYNEYLDKFIFCTLKGTSISLCLSDSVTGPYKDVYSVCNGVDYPGLYGGFLHEKFMDTDGERMYIQLSRWTPIYNTFCMEVVLK